MSDSSHSHWSLAAVLIVAMLVLTRCYEVGPVRASSCPPKPSAEAPR